MIRLCYAKLQAQATDDTLSAQSDARPGGHAKWVQIPRGLATVSGERHANALKSSHCFAEAAGRRRAGRPACRADPQVRKPVLRGRPVLGATTPKEHSMHSSRCTRWAPACRVASVFVSCTSFIGRISTRVHPIARAVAR